MIFLAKLIVTAIMAIFYISAGYAIISFLFALAKRFNHKIDAVSKYEIIGVFVAFFVYLILKGDGFGAMVFFLFIPGAMIRFES